MSRMPVIAVPAMGLNPADPTQVLPGLEACKSPNPSSLKNGCMGTAPSMGMDQYGLWCASGSSGGLQVFTSTPRSSSRPCLPVPTPLAWVCEGCEWVQDTCATPPAWRDQPPRAVGSLCRAGLNLFQINSQVVGGEYAGPLLLGISKRSLLEGQASTPAYAAYSGWHADTMFSLVPSKTQVTSHTGQCAHAASVDAGAHLACQTQACSRHGPALHPTHRGVECHVPDSVTCNGNDSHCISLSCPKWYSRLPCIAS